MGERVLIVNADDFGLSPGINEGVVRAHAEGIVTSASLMVRAPHAADAAARALAHPRLGVGLHLDLQAWRYRGEPWIAAYADVPLDDATAIGAEVAAQIERFMALTGRAPTHIDSHRHVHRREPARTVVCEHGARLGIAVRDCDSAIRFEGRFYGEGDIEPAALCALLRALPAGVTELGCHPGLDDAALRSFAGAPAGG